ncbi:MAG TPA: protein kinase [Vicinamibacteria bacterium]|nr:protein kinase [Vicinamibacteria bacterium]
MPLPSHIGRFRVLAVVGEGAMGVLYRARDEALERDVALKVMRAQAADAADRERFLREARAVARLQHPNIVTLYELGDHEGSPFIAMELLEGVDLQRAIESGLRPNPRATLPIVLQVLAGLGHAHGHGIVHRDVKPSNVFLPRGQPAKIMDFGVAHLGGTASTSGLIVGTPSYMSPEQVQARPVDGRSDLFSAGLILYELVTGEKAYRGDSVVALVYKIAHEEPDLTLIPRGSKWDRLRGVLTRALFKDAERRYPSAAAMSADVALALADLGGAVDGGGASDIGMMRRASFTAEAPRPASPLAPAPAPTPASKKSALPLAPPADERRARPAWLLPAVVGVVVLAVGAGLLVPVLFRPSAPPAPTPRASASPPPAGGGSVVATASRVRPSRVSSAPLASSPPTSLVVPPHPRVTQIPAVAASPGAPASESSASAARLDRANTLYESGHYAAAVEAARAVLRREPANAEARSLLEDIEVDRMAETRLKQAREAWRRGDRETALAEVRAGLAVKATDARLLALFRELTQ